MTDFGKLDFSVSFDPTSAFPIDARGYFESLAEAEAAAASAKEAGSSESVYYIGQTVAVVENGAASFYIIDADNTLKSVGGESDTEIKTTVEELKKTANTGLRFFIRESDGMPCVEYLD